MKLIAIIPARGGSKGIPGKNIRPVGGKPLLAWSIGQARQTPQITRVFVSTDSNEIAAVARDYGAEVIMRPPEISGDTASSESCLVHALDWLEGAKCQAPSAKDASRFSISASPWASNPDLVVFLQATSPLRKPDDIQKAIETFEREQADSLFSACRVEGFVWRVEEDGTPRSFSYNHLDRPRRQDAPEDLIENGSIYIFKPWVLRRFNNRLGGKIAVYRMPALHSFQIDEPADLELIEALMASRHRTTGPQDQKLERTVASSQQSVVSGQWSVVSGQWSVVKLLVLDFDGVLTDNRVLVQEDGTEAVYCSRVDGMGIGMLKAAGVEVIVISKEKNPVVAARCRKLDIKCIQGCDDKLAELKLKAESRKLKETEIAYVGNDLNDLECLRWVGLPIAVADAVPEVKSIATIITMKSGGQGAVREISDWLLAHLS